MTISLSDGTTSINLPPALLWQEEFSWSPVQQTVQPTVTGAQIVQVGVYTSGRPITLTPFDGNSGAMKGAVLAQLRTWAALPGQIFSLTIRGVARDVIFRHQDRALEVAKWIHYEDLDDNDNYFVTVRFMETA